MNWERLVNRPLNFFGFEMSRTNGDFGDNSGCYMLSPKQAAKFRTELSDTAYNVFSGLQLGADINKAKIQKIVDGFLEIYHKRPITWNTGGGKFHNCFWLYVTARCLEPSLIVESGSWRGQTSWILRQTSPQAEMHCFDLNFNHLIYKDKSINYHEHDWGRFNFLSVDPARSLVFIDDHTNQAKRVNEAWHKGFRTLIFDDNPPAHKLFSYTYIKPPTIDMLLDKDVRPGETIEWVYKGRRKSCIYREEDIYSARELIRDYLVFPDIFRGILYGLHNFLSLVTLVD